MRPYPLRFFRDRKTKDQAPHMKSSPGKSVYSIMLDPIAYLNTSIGCDKPADFNAVAIRQDPLDDEVSIQENIEIGEVVFLKEWSSAYRNLG